MEVIQDVLEALFRQSPLVQLAVFALNGLLTFALSFGILMFFHRRTTAGAWTPVAPSYSAVTTLFALFLAFHAAGIWSNKTHAERAFLTSGTAIKRLGEMLGPAQLDLAPARDALRHYVRYVFRDEYKNRNARRGARTETVLQDLEAKVMAANATVPAAAAAQLNAALNDIVRTRYERLWVGANHTEAVSWLGVIVLGVLAHLAVAAVHFDKPRAGAVALALFGLTTTLAYTSLGVVDDPYRLLDLDITLWLPDS
jgi:uncharacterized membrane protein HdeD (DUF308 family)